MLEAEARKHDFSSSDLSFYIERLQILLYFIDTDLAGNLDGHDEAQERAQDLWELCESQSYFMARVPLTWFRGYAFMVPQSHRRSYNSVLKDIDNALG